MHNEIFPSRVRRLAVNSPDLLVQWGPVHDGGMRDYITLYHYENHFLDLDPTAPPFTTHVGWASIGERDLQMALTFANTLRVAVEVAQQLGASANRAEEVLSRMRIEMPTEGLRCAKDDPS